MSDIVVVVAEIILGLAFLTLVGAAVGVVVNRLTTKRSPTEMLQERYVRGELTGEQYAQMSRNLAGTSSVSDRARFPQPNGHEAEPIPTSGRTTQPRS